VAPTSPPMVRETIESGAWQGTTLIAPAAEPSDARAGNGEIKPNSAGRPRRFRPAAHGKK
jgi:hypothetical protein